MRSGFFAVLLLLFGKAFAAVHRASAARLKGNAAGLAALGADRLELHFSRSVVKAPA